LNNLANYDEGINATKKFLLCNYLFI